MAALADFLKTGALGPITVGMNPFEVTSLLGEPQEESREESVNPQVRFASTYFLETCRTHFKFTTGRNRSDISARVRKDSLAGRVK